MSEHEPLRTFDTVDEIVTECVIPSLRDEGLYPDDYDPVGIALSVSERVDGRWVVQTILLRDRRWSHLPPTDPTKRLVERARIADRAIRRATTEDGTDKLPALEVRRGQVARAAFRAGASAETIARRMHREDYRVYDWIKAANNGRLPRR